MDTANLIIQRISGCVSGLKTTQNVFELFRIRSIKMVVYKPGHGNIVTHANGC